MHAGTHKLQACWYDIFGHSFCRMAYSVTMPVGDLQPYCFRVCRFVTYSLSVSGVFLYFRANHASVVGGDTEIPPR